MRFANRLPRHHGAAANPLDLADELRTGIESLPATLRGSLWGIQRRIEHWLWLREQALLRAEGRIAELELELATLRFDSSSRQEPFAPSS